MRHINSGKPIRQNIGANDTSHSILTNRCNVSTPGTCAAHMGGALGGGIYAFAEKRIRQYRARRRMLRTANATRHTTSPEEMHAELDKILAKVGRSGYASLNEDERHRLFEISQRLK